MTVSAILKAAQKSKSLAKQAVKFDKSAPKKMDDGGVPNIHLDSGALKTSESYSQGTGLDADQAAELQKGIQQYRTMYGVQEDGTLGIPYLRQAKENGNWSEIHRVMKRHSEDNWFSSELRVGRPNYDEDLDYRLDKFNWQAETIVMSPDEYIEQATRVLSKMEDNPNLTRAEVENTRQDSYLEIRRKMIENPEFDIPYLQMTSENPGQEGINRAMAARDLGIKEMPVLVIRDKPKPQADDVDHLFGQNVVLDKDGYDAGDMEDLTSDDMDFFLKEGIVSEDDVKNLSNQVSELDDNLQMSLGINMSVPQAQNLSANEIKKIQDMIDNEIDPLTVMEEIEKTTAVKFEPFSTDFETDQLIDSLEYFKNTTNIDLQSSQIAHFSPDAKASFMDMSFHHKKGMLTDEELVDNFNDLYFGELLSNPTVKTNQPKTTLEDLASGRSSSAPSELLQLEGEEAADIDLIGKFRRNIPDVVTKYRQGDLSMPHQVFDKSMQSAIRAGVDKMSNTEIAAINFYTRNGDELLNSYLRTGDVMPVRERRGDSNSPLLPEEQVEERINSLTNRLNSALDKLPNYEGIAFRSTGLGIPRNELEAISGKYEIGEIVTEPAFTSFSSEPRSGKINFFVQSKTAKPIRQMSEFVSEEEVLYKSGSKFKVVDKYVDGIGDTHIFMEEVQ